MRLTRAARLHPSEHDQQEYLRRLRLWQTLTQSVAVVLLVLVTLLLTRSEAFHFDFGWRITVTLIVVVLALIGARVLLADKFRIPLVPVDESSESVDDEDERVLNYLERFAEGHHTVAANASVLSALAIPALRYERISQKASLTDRRWKIAVRAISRAPSGTTLVAVHRNPKGVLLGALKVEIDGQRVPTLQYDEAKGFLLDATDSLLHAAFAGGAQYSQMSDRVLRALAKPTALTEDDQTSLLRDLEEALTGTQAAEVDQRVLIGLVRSATAADIIFAAVPAPSASAAHRLDLEYDLHLPRAYSGRIEWLRVALGLGLRSFELPIPLAVEARSFHLDVTGPAGTYVFRSGVVDPGSALRARRAEASRSSGDNQTHLYIRDRPAASQSALGTAAPGFLIRFREIPPGIVGSVLVVSTWLAILSWFVGIYHDAVFKTQGPATAWPTLLFGVPAVLTGWVVARAGKEALGAISIPSFFLMAWLAVNSASVVIVAALKSAQIDNPPLRVVLPVFGSQTVEHPTWTLVMVSTGLCFASALFNYANKTASYLRVINSTALLSRFPQ